MSLELEALDAAPWQAFWARLGADAAAIGHSWRPFVLRYPSATAALWPQLHQALAGWTFADLARVAAQTGMSLCPVRGVAQRRRDPDVLAAAGLPAPWRLITYPGAAATASGQVGARPGDLPLAGLRVVESCRRVQGPLAGRLLLLLGAEVVRIEPPGGDPLRGMPPMAGDCSARFVALNHGKQVVEVDIRTPAGQAEAGELVREADIFVQNWAPGAAERYRLDAEHLQRIRPGLVYAQASAWGGSWDSGDPPLGTDFMVQAHSGLAEVLGEPGSPRPSLITLLDLLGAQVCIEGVLAGLARRYLDGRGGRVESSLVGAADVLLAEALGPGALGPEAGRARSRTSCGALPQPITGVFDTADEPLALAARSATSIDALCRAVGIPAPTHPQETTGLRAQLEPPLRTLPAAVRMLVSSGTEAEPKIVAYSHNALVGGRDRFLARLAPPDGSPMRALFGVPLGSSFGSYATVGVLVTLGGSVVLLPRFDPGEALAAIAAHRPTHVFGVPTMFQRLLSHPTLPATDVSSLVAVVSGGALIDPPTAQKCVARLGCAFVSLYGSADGVNCHTLLDDPLPVAQYTVGRPNATICDIRITDTADRPVRHGEVGEILARGPMSPLCYVHAPELDERYRTPEGWVRTGDRGFLDDDGRLRLVGRSKEIVIRGGTNISPAEVEVAVAAHEDVVSAACIGVPDTDLGQRVCACVALRAGAPPLDMARLGAFLDSSGLERHKFPEQLVVLDELPITPAGKVDKRVLLELATRTAPRDPVSVRAAVRRFTEEEILPREALLTGPDGPEVLADLQRRARSAGLWGVYYPPELGGAGFTLPEYLAIAEQEGRALHGPAVSGADATLDARMLHESGSDRVRRKYLAPLAAGTAVASYGMTEPGTSGSDASLLRTEARLAQGMWTVRGRKWFICRGGRATFTTVVARTEALGRPLRSALSLIVVPAGTPGFRVVRPLPMLGLEADQWELEFADARVPEDHLVGQRGKGSAVIGRRLNLGRLLRAMHWLGQAQRAFDLMCLRLRQRRTLSGVLADKQLMHQHVFTAYTEICAARSLLRRAATVFDADLPTTSDVSAAKVAASQMVNDVLDRAVQVFGAEGLLHPFLSVAHRMARGTRIYDGPDEIHLTTTAQRILASYDDTIVFDFTDPLDG